MADTDRSMPKRDTRLDALAGLLAAAVALGLIELISGALGRVSLIVSVGDLVVDYSPSFVVKTAISLFGTNDKAVLLCTIVLVCLGAGAALGPVAARRPRIGMAALAAFAAAGTLAAARDPRILGILAAGIAAVAAFGGWQALRLLLRAAAPRPVTAGATMPGTGAADRRRFLAFAGTAAAASAASVVVGRRGFGPAVDVDAQRAAIMLPETQAPEEASALGLAVAGLSPLITPNDRFYRIDTALVVPRVDVNTWSLKITGMVDNPFTLTFADLQELATLEEAVTLACVSNEVGGNLVGNAVWLGVPLSLLLQRANVQPGATQIIGRSVDGFTVGFPTEVAMDGRPAMVAIAMNGEPLPARHGFPARLVVPGLYGYVSATKWLEEIELTRLEAFDAYWIPRGWSKEAPIKTQSRIDVPRGGQAVTAGRVPIAGVAWGGLRSIDAVEVRVLPWRGEDGGQWLQARLGPKLAQSTWRQWVLEWDAVPGDYRVEVRATDGEGVVQTDIQRPPAPDGATGHHAIRVVVREA
jgi:DMSO/TMAO reductase YedYZ molybdopterin-dependent catalytic subunit